MATLQELLGTNLVPMLQNKNRINPLAVDMQQEEPVARAIANAPQPVQPPIQAPQAPKALDPQEILFNQMKQLEAERQAKLAPLLEKQKQDNEMKRNTLAAYLEKTSPKLDLSPLAALVDSSTGSKFAQSYKAGPGVNDLVDNAVKQQAGIAAGDKDIAELQMRALQDKMGGKLMQAQLANDRNKRFDESSINNIRKEITSSPAYKDYQDVETARQSVKQLVADPTAFGDLSTMFTYMKALDPGSVVREGEQMLFKKTGSVDDRMTNLLNRFVNGESLTDSQRQQLITSVDKLAAVRAKTYDNYIQPAIAQAKRRGIPEEEIDPYYHSRTALQSMKFESPQQKSQAQAVKEPRKLNLNGKILTEGIDF